MQRNPLSLQTESFLDLLTAQGKLMNVTFADDSQSADHIDFDAFDQKLHKAACLKGGRWDKRTAGTERL